MLVVLAGLAAVVTDSQFLETKQDRLSWRGPLVVVTGTVIVLVSLVACSPDSDILYILLIVPIVSLTCLALLVAAAIRRKPRRCLSTLLTLAAFLGVSWGLLRNQGTIRAYSRWLLWSRSFKAEVLAQPAPANGELRHMVWERTGFAGVANNTVYFVFDPTDSLAAAHSPGKLKGIPCPVYQVRRLESHWYSVWFYLDQSWSQCPESRQAH